MRRGEIQQQLDRGGIDYLQEIAVDGAGTVWLPNDRGDGLGESSGAGEAGTATPLSRLSGFGSDASISEPHALSIDPSGNIWVSHHGNSAIRQFFGVAAPVMTHL